MLLEKESISSWSLSRTVRTDQGLRVEVLKAWDSYGGEHLVVEVNGVAVGFFTNEPYSPKESDEPKRGKLGPDFNAVLQEIGRAILNFSKEAPVIPKT